MRHEGELIKLILRHLKCQAFYCEKNKIAKRTSRTAIKKKLDMLNTSGLKVSGSFGTLV